MVIEAFKAARITKIADAEVIDIRCLTPIDTYTLDVSLKKTGYLVVADTGQEACGIAAEVISQVAQKSFTNLKGAPKCVTLPHIPTPTSPALADHFYPDYRGLMTAAHSALMCKSHCTRFAAEKPMAATPTLVLGHIDETRRHF